jgi:hypothetical protein
MNGRRLRRAILAAAVAVGGLLVALAVASGGELPLWSVPLLTAAVLLVAELVSLFHSLAPDARVERSAATVVVTGRLLVTLALSLAGATVALLAAAVPARHGVATGLLGLAAAIALFLLVTAVARRGREE